MSFTSHYFAIFVTIVFFSYYFTLPRNRYLILLFASYIFYSFAGIQYLFLLIYITAVSYILGLYLEQSEPLPLRKVLVTILIIIAPLLYFKYTGFIVENINVIIAACSSAVQLSTMEIALPIGISFYTFAALGYIIDVAKRKYPAYKKPLYLAAGLAFFPCLTAGPIERQDKIVPQLICGPDFNYKDVSYGLKLISWGIFEKMVIADNLALYVDRVFSNVHSYSGASLLIASIFFTFQIYCDFAGYSDIALGVARLFGIRLTKNFNSPYFSISIQEFWRRWHISLSTWLRDYVYISLGGNRKGSYYKHLNIIITMLVSGIWHGAAWTFVAWGGIYGIFQVIEDYTGVNTKISYNRLIKVFRMLIIFSIVSILWIFFKSSSFGDAWYVLNNMFNGITDVKTYLYSIHDGINISKIDFAIIGIELLLLNIYDYYSLKENVIEKISSKPLMLRWTIYIAFILFIVRFLSSGAAVNFVYAGF